MALGFERLSSHGRATKGGLWRTIQSGVVIGAITTLVLLLGLTASGWSGTCLWSGSCAPALAPLPKDSHHVHRFIVPNAQQPAMDYIRSLGISQAVMLDCSPTAAALAKRQLFDDRGISLICLQDEDMTRPLAGSNPTAVVTTSQEGSGIGLSQTLALANLMHGSSRGGSGVRSGLCAVVEFHADNSGAPVRASVLDLQRRDRRVWFASTRVYLDVFNKIYEERTWTDAGGGSGLGSTLEYTANVRAQLVDVIKSFGITSMMDTSCGSMAWMPQALEEIEAHSPGFMFAGSDVVCSLIERHRSNFTAKANWRFDCIDYANQPLPSGYDLVWSRDSLQHVPLHATWQFLNNVKASGARYLLVGSYLTSEEPNTNIAAGDYYRINLLKPPFNLRPAPLLIIDEHSPPPHVKFMLLFDVNTLVWDDDLMGL